MTLARGHMNFDSCVLGQYTRCDPIVGGISVSNATRVVSTLSLPVYDSSGNKGFIMSGHGAGATYYGGTSGGNIGQPNVVNRVVGVVETDPSLNGRQSDSALVKITNSSLTIGKNLIYQTDTTSFIVLAKKTSDETPDGTTIEKQGIATNLTSGVIHMHGFTVQNDDGTTLQNQMLGTYSSAGGDSGSPVFTPFSSGSNYVYYVGDHVGTYKFINGTTYPIYSPWEGIVKELPIALPTNVTTITTNNSPTISDSYGGEKRTLVIKNVTYGFYYDGTSIKYKTSTNDGATWSSEVSLGTGTLVSDTQRWSLINATYAGTSYIYVFYWVQGSPDTQNHHFKLIRGTVSSDGSTVSWSSPIDVGYTLANSDCGTGGACAAVVASSDSTGTLWAVWRYKPGGKNDYYFEIKYSNDGGFTWYDSWSNSDIGSTYPPTMALTKLSSGRMLWAYTFYNTNTLYYKDYVPNQGWYSYSTTISGWPTSGNKQISADTNSTIGKAYVALVSGGTSGSINVLRFSNTGTLEATEAPPSGSLSHSLPSIDITPDGVVRIFTIANSKVYETKKVGSTWIGPNLPWGSTFSNPDQLTVGIWKYIGLWNEGGNIKFSFGYN